jgi:hypothetical protein
MIHNPTTCKLGKSPAVHPKGLRMMASLTIGLPEPPPAVGWYKGINGKNGVLTWPMDLNDSLGDCTIAGIAHLIQLWTTLTGSPIVPPDAQVKSEYSRLCGYVDGQPSTDNGGVESDLLAEWKSGGILGTKIDDFVGVNPQSQIQMRDAIHYFGGAYLGVELPISAQDQDIWDVPAGGAVGDGAPGSWGGHAIVAVVMDARYVGVITWGSLKLATIEWLSTYCSEAYAIISPDWIKNGMTPGGVPLTSLNLDLGKIVKS